MSQKYYAIVTNLGAAKIANAAALGTRLSITQMAVGDGGGTLPTPNASQTKLINEKRRAAINTLSIDPANASQVIAEQVIPETEGGFWIREMGLFDADGTLIAVCNTPETYKPALQEGSGRTQTVRMVLIVNSTDAITLKIDPSVVLATRQYADDKSLEVRQYVDKKSQEGKQYTDDKSLEAQQHADELMKKHLDAASPHTQYLQILNLFTEIKDLSKTHEALENLGIKVTTGQTYLSARIGSLILIVGNSTSATSSDGNIDVKFPFSFPNTIFYMNVTQANQSYAVDTNPLLFSPYPAPAGPVTGLGAAVRNSKTGNPINSTVVASRYLAIGY
ncbi:phage tail protein [Pantoea allii]|uniref:phage tail protein n=1 Tax=Pantoea allii TaxID=574096 RepID=UPI001F4DDE1A|nr:phage tail protein [Pantoea allii]MCH9300556.1 phage tail protein [Pantoea allii]